MLLKSFVVIEKEGRILLIQEASGKWRGKWFLPGGKADIREDAIAAAQREVMEEAGVKCTVNGVFALSVTKYIFSSSCVVYFIGETDSTDVKTICDKHSLGAKWFKREEIAQLNVRKNLHKILEMYYKKSFMPVGNLKLYL